MTPQPDSELQRRLAEGARARDPDAWERIYRDSYTPLFAYARRRLTSEVEADDAVSETMTRAIQAIDGFHWGGSSVQAWLFGILRRVVLEAQRRSGRGTEPLDIEPPDMSPGPAGEAETKERTALLRAAFAELSESDQELLELRFAGGLGSEEIASVVGKRRGAVRMAQSRALERLRESMEARERA